MHQPFRPQTPFPPGFANADQLAAVINAYLAAKARRHIDRIAVPEAERCIRSSVKAVEDDRAHILSSPVTTGVRSIIGELYLAKWFHPDFFEDIDPEEVHEELIQELFGQKLEGVYVYP